MSIKKLEKIMSAFPSFRLKQTKEAIFHKLISSWNESNLPKDIKEKLSIEFPVEFKSELSINDDQASVKAKIFFTKDEIVETVLMKHKDGRNTVCVSSQIGCPLKCVFCATGNLGLRRNLTAWEIIIQVLVIARFLKKSKEKISNVVFMGMGEPFLNYDEVMHAINILNNEQYFNIGARKISISTAGIITGIQKLEKEKLQINLAISLHAPNNILRSKLMPINDNYNIDGLLKIVANYITNTRRRVMIEYLLIKNINDSEKEANELVLLLKKYFNDLFFINLIPCNPTEKYQASSNKQIKEFKNILENNGIFVVQRYSFGHKITGACGQLAGEKN